MPVTRSAVTFRMRRCYRVRQSIRNWPKPRQRGRYGRAAQMTRVLLTTDDLAHIRFGESPAPLVETVMGMVVLRRQLPVAVGSRWPGRDVPATARPLWDLIPLCGYWPEFLDPVVGDLETGLDQVCATPRRRCASSWPCRGSPP